MKFDKSLANYEAATKIPGRSLTRSKAPGRMFPVGSGPMFMNDRVGGTRGPTIRDIDGNSFLDMVCALGAVSIGYEMTCAFSGGVFSLPSVVESEAADVVVQHVAPWASRVRFTKTGSEATHAAYRIAKAWTGRKYVLVGDWAYHGWHEWCNDTSFPMTFRYPHERYFEDGEVIAGGIDGRPVYGVDIAAVFVEPHRWVRTDVRWLKHLREFCDSVGALLVFDEMIYGCRWAMGGATEYFGVVPDLACFGKAIGNGASIACVVGKGLPMERHGEIPSGTYSGETSALDQTVVTIKYFASENLIEVLWLRGKQLRRGLNAAIADAGWSGRAVVEGAGDVHLRVRFNRDGDGVRFATEMVNRGILWHPDVVNVCAAHSERDIEIVVRSAEDALRAMSKE